MSLILSRVCLECMQPSEAGGWRMHQRRTDSGHRVTGSWPNAASTNSCSCKEGHPHTDWALTEGHKQVQWIPSCNCLVFNDLTLNDENAWRVPVGANWWSRIPQFYGLWKHSYLRYFRRQGWGGGAATGNRSFPFLIHIFHIISLFTFHNEYSLYLKPASNTLLCNTRKFYLREDNFVCDSKWVMFVPSGFIFSIITGGQYIIPYLA